MRWGICRWSGWTPHCFSVCCPQGFERGSFLWQETRKADKTGVIQLAGNRYEVDARLARKTLTVRYDPYDLTITHCEYQGQIYSDATPLVLQHHRYREVPTRNPRRRRRRPV
ncbi:Mu transposase C-terminal domain-containing protein [Sulfobacillus harzensis]|uniref:Mu transposase C-terminal domain-containing protein n=1 Tax=Sulfobacillus harzensis TaxID=2729629 RepID=UPI001FAE32E3|nr:Mu transposase C-terminal domain-containing protein [Sulfobacillus harzensis]